MLQMKKFKSLSYCMIVISFFYSYFKERFFGSNFFAESADEVLADGIFLILFFMSMIALMLSHQEENKNSN